MKFLLAAINAKYIHSNLGIYSLKTYAESKGLKNTEVLMAEYTINHQMDAILQDIYKKKPDAVGFSCYIWNLSYIIPLTRDLKQVLPDLKIWLGGPEVSYNASEILEKEPQIYGIMEGEGEESFYQILKEYEKDIPDFSKIAGVSIRGTKNACCTCMDMSSIPFPYKNLEGMEHRIIYYESSRGCPFSCSYCLSSIDKSVRYRNLELVKEELQFFLDQKVPQVKFVDRTFNCNRVRTKELWQFIQKNDNGITNFHFEVSADLINEEELEILSKMRPGLVQLEIGIQSTCPETIKEIRRTMNIEKLKKVVSAIKSFGNIHQHLDLIVGLPYEGYERFIVSFNEVYEMQPDQLQLGFLKVLKGSYMFEKAADYGIIYHQEPVYEVMKTNWITYDEILKLKAVEDMVEVYYNSGQFSNTIKMFEKMFNSPFDLFYQIAVFYEQHNFNDRKHNRLDRYEILYKFALSITTQEEELLKIRDAMMIDLYLRENLKSRPSFASDPNLYKEQIKDYFKRETEYEPRQIVKMAHIEILESKKAYLFDYMRRDPLSYNAAMLDVTEKICWEE